VPFGAGALLTVAQAVSGSNELALLFPWRVSAVLVPAATAVILGRLVALPALPVGSTAVRWTSAVVLVGLAVVGVWISVGRHAFHTASEEEGLYAFVRETRKPGDVYLLPVKVPDLAATTRGSLSSDFKPIAERRADSRIIPVDLQRFRLHTGAPIYVDFKAIPYKDTEVIEWGKRLETTAEAQRVIQFERKWEWPATLHWLSPYGVTHVVRPARESQMSHVFFVQLVYKDQFYEVYRLSRTDPRFPDSD
jgi:hypothetical protein